MRRNGWENDKTVGNDTSSCKVKRETEKISVMGRIKVRRRQGRGWMELRCRAKRD